MNSQTHEFGIGTEAAQFHEKEYTNGIFVAVQSIGLRAAHEDKKLGTNQTI
jgi:hypothetical protein